MVSNGADLEHFRELHSPNHFLGVNVLNLKENYFKRKLNYNFEYIEIIQDNGLFILKHQIKFCGLKFTNIETILGPGTVSIENVSVKTEIIKVMNFFIIINENKYVLLFKLFLRKDLNKFIKTILNYYILNFLKIQV